MTLEALQGVLRDFAQARDWEKFHSPKNLAMALGAESGELLEIFQWLTEDESRALTEAQHRAVSEELADIFIYLVRLADIVKVDLEVSVADKVADNNRRYHTAGYRGTARKAPHSEGEPGVPLPG